MMKYFAKISPETATHDFINWAAKSVGSISRCTSAGVLSLLKLVFLDMSKSYLYKDFESEAQNQ